MIAPSFRLASRALLAAAVMVFASGLLRAQAEFDLEGPRLTAYRTSFERMRDITRAMHKAGEPLITGADSPDGLALHREIALYARAGIESASALRAATLDASGRTDQIDR